MSIHLRTRHLLDRSFTGVGIVSIALLAASVLLLLAPVVVRGIGAFVFVGTVEHRKVQLDRFGHGDRAAVQAEAAKAALARTPAYTAVASFETWLATNSFAVQQQYRAEFKEVRAALCDLLGPMPDKPMPALVRLQYGQTRGDRVQVVLRDLLYREEWDYSDPTRMGTKKLVPRAPAFAGTPLAGLFPCVEQHIDAMLLPRRTFYWQFLTDGSVDAHFFGGIMPELLGTFYLTLGAMLFAIPIGVLSAVYLSEYAREGRVVRLIRTCMSTLAGVPSIVFGLFGLACFINTLHVSPSKSVLAGSLTLGLLVLPTVIRAAEEAIKSVPQTYREAALSLGAGKWHTTATVVLPSALPGILTGIVISMGRAAGETAPIIFTAAVSVGRPLRLWEVFSQPTPALPWNIYNLCTEHVAVDEIRHVQYGMLLVLVALVLALNLAAILVRARIARSLKT